jgi:TRAP transporter TAXI family solute receptor
VILKLPDVEKRSVHSFHYLLLHKRGFIMMGKKWKNLGCFVAVAFFLLAFPLHGYCQAKPSHISIGTTRAGSATYMIGAGFSKVITKYTGISSTPEATGYGLNVALLQKGELEMGTTYASEAYFAVRGQKHWKEKGKMDKLRLMWWGYYIPWGMVVLDSSDIKKPEDLKGRRVMYILPPSPTVELVGEAWLAGAGLTKADFTPQRHTGSKEGVPALMEGRTDVFGYPCTVGASWLEMASKQKKLRYLELSEAQLSKVLKETPWLSKWVTPAGGYPGLADDYNTVAQPTVLLTRSGLPDEVVTDMMKAILDHPDDVKGAHVKAIDWIQDPARPGVIPFHAGAVKYFKGKGMWTAEMERQQKATLLELGWNK